MASSCGRAGSDWLLGRISLQKGLLGVGMGCPGQGGSPSLEGLKSRVEPALRDLVELGTVGVRFMVELEDLQGLFQP